jgi:orotidine-5'-phosphate decarboxylase
MTFRERLRGLSSERRSRVILALDIPITEPAEGLERAIRILEQTSDKIAAVKLNQQVILPLGMAGVRDIVDHCKGLGLPCIADLKLGDIGDTNRVVAQLLFKNGFDALIASPLPGVEDGLAPLMELAGAEGRGVFLLVYMSHRGAREVFGAELSSGGKLYHRFIEMSKTLSVDGVVVGATWPSILREVRSLLGPEALILAPGVGVQGGREDVVSCGADFAIVGRAVVNAPHPRDVVERIRRANWSD